MIDFAVLALVYGLVFFRTWRDRGADVLLVNTLLYGYLVLVLYVTLMPVIASLPFIFQHSYVPMNLVPFLDVLEGRGDFARQVVLNVIMTLPFGFLFPLTGNRRGGLLRTVWFCFLLGLGIGLLQPLIMVTGPPISRTSSPTQREACWGMGAMRRSGRLHTASWHVCAGEL